MKTKRIKPISSAAQAAEEMNQLPNYWSDESQLTQRVLIYIASLLEKQTTEKKRTPSAYQRHVAKTIKAGGTMKDAAESWKK